MNIHTQDTRAGKLTTPLGKDVLVLLRFSGDDHVNGLFEYSIDALSTQPNIDFDALIGTHATVELASQNNGPRHFDGIVTQARWAGVGENGNKYSLTLRPWFWLAGQRRNQRIFHNKTVVQIIEELLQPYAGLGSPALENRLTGNYSELEYTVQYRESDLAFATRLMERFGISYHFKHADGSHTLVLTDDIGSHQAVPGKTRAYKRVNGQHHADSEHFWEWYPERNMTTGAVRLTDYNFKKPLAVMEVDHTGDAAFEQGQIESYDYPGDYLAQGQGQSVVGLRVDQERGQDHRHRAVGDCTSLGAGMTVSLTGDPVPGVADQAYLCLSATHSYVSDAYGSGGVESDGYAYSGAYVLMPVTAPLAPERKTPVPAVLGPQTAVVVGEGEIDCDEYGRILVHFHWDLEKAFSMRCRVSQNWASQGWGGMVIPRIGMEVIVEFLEGDPDKPVVTGCVYNGKNKVPYELPKHKTRSTFKTDTHMGTGFNELRFEDKKGEEEIFVHAQKDLTEKVENHHTLRVDRTQVLSVGRNRFSEITGQDSTRVGGDMSIIVSGNGKQGFPSGNWDDDSQGIRRVGYALDRTRPLDKGNGNFRLNTQGDIALGAKASISVNSQKNITLTSQQNLDISVGKSYFQSIGDKLHLSVSGDAIISTGRSKRESVGRNLFIDAAKEINLRCGSCSIKMSKDGTLEIKGVHIIINGKKVNIN